METIQELNDLHRNSNIIFYFLGRMKKKEEFGRRKMLKRKRRTIGFYSGLGSWPNINLL